MFVSKVDSKQQGVQIVSLWDDNLVASGTKWNRFGFFSRKTSPSLQGASRSKISKISESLLILESAGAIMDKEFVHNYRFVEKYQPSIESRVYC